MNKMPLFTISLLSIFISASCYANKEIVLNEKSLSDAEIVLNKEGKTQVDIINSNENNISHIYYDQFNVNNRGIILKNNNADLIINEVISDKSSHLAGELALQGKSATVIIANPNGISCFDCSFFGINDIKLITGSTTDKFSKKFTLTNNHIKFNFKVDENDSTHINRIYKDISPEYINIISNDVQLNEGELNAKYIRFDIGLEKYIIDHSNKYNDVGFLSIGTNSGINSRELIIKGKGTTVFNSGKINSLSLKANLYSWFNGDNTSIDLNGDENPYRTPSDGEKKSVIKAGQDYLGIGEEEGETSFSIKNSKLVIQANRVLAFDKKFNVDSSYVWAKGDWISFTDATLKQSYLHASTLPNDNNDWLVINQKISGTAHVVLEGTQGRGNFDDKSKLMLEGKKIISLNGHKKFRLGKSEIKYRKEISSNAG